MEHENRRRYQDVTEAEYLPKKHVGFATRAIHAGQHPDKEHGSVNVPIHMSSTFAQREPTQLYSEFDYARCNNPTRNAFEQCMAACEYGNHALEFASGCGAMTAVLHLLGSADHVVCCDDVYGGTQRYMRRFLQEKHGIEVTFVDMTNLAETEAAIRPNTRLVWIETPTNPMLKIIDVETVTRLVRAKRGNDAWVLVDNTFATPYLQSPLEYGCDMVLHSLSKYIGGHSDLIGGAVVMKDKDLYEQLFFSAKSVGANPSAFDSYLVLRGLKTLEARMKIHCKNALILARWLERHPHVEKVLYPGLESHPQHELAKRQMRGFGGMISFYVKGDRPQANKFLSSLKVFTLAESLGGVESLVEHPASMTHGSVPLEHRNKLGILEGFIRVSVGIEDVQDLIDDLDEALELSQKV